MPTAQELEAKLWKAIRSDRTMMLGLDGLEDGHVRPMTAQLDDDEKGGPIWFFTSADNNLLPQLAESGRAIAAFSSTGHDLFATVHGSLSLDNDRATIERLWNPFIAAWFKGMDDPDLRLLRLDAEEAQVWLNENNIFAGLKMLLGVDPKKSYEDKVATVELD